MKLKKTSKVKFYAFPRKMYPSRSRVYVCSGLLRSACPKRLGCKGKSVCKCETPEFNWGWWGRRSYRPGIQCREIWRFFLSLAPLVLLGRRRSLHALHCCDARASPMQRTDNRLFGIALSDDRTLCKLFIRKLYNAYDTQLKNWPIFQPGRFLTKCFNLIIVFWLQGPSTIFFNLSLELLPVPCKSTANFFRSGSVFDFPYVHQYAQPLCDPRAYRWQGTNTLGASSMFISCAYQSSHATSTDPSNSSHKLFSVPNIPSIGNAPAAL